MTSIREPDTSIGIADLRTFVKETYARALALDPLSQFLPDVEQLENTVVLDPPVLKLRGYVTPGMPNKLQVYEPAGLTAMPAYFRGGDGELTRPAQIGMLVSQAMLMMSVLRSQALLGGINIVDYDSGVSVTAPSPLKAPVEIETIDQDLLKALTPHLLLSGQTPGYVIVNSVIAEQVTKVLSLLEVSQALKVVPVSTLYDHQKPDGDLVRQYLWPIKKVVFIKGSDPRVGRTAIVRGESPDQTPGIWARCQKKGTVEDTMPWENPLEPKEPHKNDIIQVGMAGLPVIEDPTRVHVFTIKTAGDDFVEASRFARI